MEGNCPNSFRPPLPESQAHSELSKYTVDGLQPEQVFAPKAADEITEVLRQANSQSWTVVPFGAGSKQHIGNTLGKYDVALSTQYLNQIPEYEPQDLVVKMESGCRLIDLQARLAQDRLCLPIDPPSYAEATVGGIVSANASGPLRFSQGTIRDFLLGISVVQPDGTRTKFGSRVVKNVTGYDMCKLYTGSFGTLGVLVDFYLKLKPLPAFEKSVVAVLKKLGDAQEALAKLLQSSLAPSAVEFLNPAAMVLLNQKFSLTKDSSNYAFIARFSDVEKAVEWQIEQLERLWEPVVSQGVIVGNLSEQDDLWEWLREDRCWLDFPCESRVKLKVNCVPDRMIEFVKQLESLCEKMIVPVMIRAHAGSGVIRAYLCFENPLTSPQTLIDHIQALRGSLRSVRGSVVVESAPLAVKKDIDVWGYDFKDKALMQQIRKQFDPHSILNPGRYVV